MMTGSGTMNSQTPKMVDVLPLAVVRRIMAMQPVMARDRNVRVPKTAPAEHAAGKLLMGTPEVTRGLVTRDVSLAWGDEKLTLVVCHAREYISPEGV